MKKIGTDTKYGDVYDGPGGSGGGYMIHVAGLGWVKNPDYSSGTMELVGVEEKPRAVQTTTQATGSTPADLIRYAMESGADLDRLERLMDMQNKWDANEARKAYVDDMAKFKMNPPKVVKDKLVEFAGTRYTHASLGAVTEAIVAGLAAHGFTHRWIPEQDGGQITVTCTITHRLGHSESVSMSSGKDDSGKKNQIQQIASAISYLSRYTLLAATGIATVDQADDDGHGFTADTSLADEWLAKVAVAPTEDDLVSLWQPGSQALAKDKLGFKEFEAAFIERRTVLAGAK